MALRLLTSTIPHAAIMERFELFERIFLDIPSLLLQRVDSEQFIKAMVNALEFELNNVNTPQTNHLKRKRPQEDTHHSRASKVVKSHHHDDALHASLMIPSQTEQHHFTDELNIMIARAVYALHTFEEEQQILLRKLLHDPSITSLNLSSDEFDDPHMLSIGENDHTWRDIDAECLHSLGHILRLTHVEALHFFEQSFSDEGAIEIAHFEGLKRLSLMACDIGDQALLAFQFNDCIEYLDIFYNDFTDTGILALSTLTALKELHITMTGKGFSPEVIEKLVANNHLESLSIDTDANSIQYIAKSKSLRTLCWTISDGRPTDEELSSSLQALSMNTSLLNISASHMDHLITDLNDYIQEVESIGTRHRLLSQMYIATTLLGQAYRDPQSDFSKAHIPPEILLNGILAQLKKIHHLSYFAHEAEKMGYAFNPK